jgi:glycosyltransferase involved in cell wall biosynthesis
LITTPSSLHICNLANVAYGNCKILKEAGSQVRLICHDIDHVMSQPEWDDQDLGLDDFPDENNFFDCRVPIKLTRPDWYCRKDIGFYSKPHVKVLSRLLPRWLKEAIRPWYLRLVYRSVLPSESHQQADRHVENKEYSTSDALKFGPNVNWLESLSGEEEVVFAYVMAPVYTLLHHDRPYVAVEIGTMRDIPFEDSANGRMLRAAYREADYVLITNPDVKKQADILGLQRYSFCPHPVDEDKFVPTRLPEFRTALLRHFPETDLIGVAPARQNWDLKGNYKYLDALRLLRFERGLKVSIVIPTWGQDIERSKAYATKIGVDSFVKWMPPVSETTLIKMYGNLDFVLDQFQLGVFGLITPKALSCGASVVTSYDRELHDWCFSEHPPILAASTAEEIANRIFSLVSTDRRAEISRSAREWFLRNHSKAVVRKVLLHAMGEAYKYFRATR